MGKTSFDITIRIHHFFDIIRDFGISPDIPANTGYQHSYHTVACLIRENPGVRMKIVLGTDSVCQGCIRNIKGWCDDPLTRKKGFTMKNDYNDYLDVKILETCHLSIGQIVTPREICQASDRYIREIGSIYQIDSEEYIRNRRDNFIAGLQYYTERIKEST